MARALAIAAEVALLELGLRADLVADPIEGIEAFSAHITSQAIRTLSASFQARLALNCPRESPGSTV